LTASTTRSTTRDGLRAAAEAALRLGFSGKSTLWPAQVATINDAFRQAR